jgi:hypothetical protein
MAGRRSPKRFSKRMVGGIIFVLTSFAGGFLASVGANMYSFLKKFFAKGQGSPLSLPQIVFLMIGVIGLALIISDLLNDQRSTRRRKVRSGA